MKTQTLVEKQISTPLGRLRLVASERGLRGVFYARHHPKPAWAGRAVPAHPVLDAAARELDDYFQGRRRAFTVPLDAPGTPFQRQVWAALAEIPYGAQRSYAQVARAVGRPRAARAVGRANATNPLSILVPCHRVVAADGSAAGYAGGARAKAWLLAHEATCYTVPPSER